MTRLVAFDKQSKKLVNVTLRTILLDLTGDISGMPAYTHIGRKTISGRIKTGSKGYVFERVS